MSRRQAVTSKMERQQPSTSLLDMVAERERAELALAPAHYPSPIALPARRIKGVEVRHEKITGSTPVIGIRQALLRGVRPANAVLAEPLRIHKLCDDEHGVWMTDLPEELFQIAEMLSEVRPWGRVLVGGLGLGILPTILHHGIPPYPVEAVKIDASALTIVERDERIIKLCGQPWMNIEHSPIYEALQRLPEFAFYLLDTWQGTSEQTWWEEVMPLKRLIRNRFGAVPAVHCWAEDIMRGQLVRRLMQPFGGWFYDAVPTPMSVVEARAFVETVGTPAWEQRYAARLDRYLAEQRAVPSITAAAKDRKSSARAAAKSKTRKR